MRSLFGYQILPTTIYRKELTVLKRLYSNVQDDFECVLEAFLVLSSLVLVINYAWTYMNNGVKLNTCNE